MDKTPEYYRAKASECRSAVARTPTDAGKSMLLGWAKGFERTAAILESKRSAFEAVTAQGAKSLSERSSAR